MLGLDERADTLGCLVEQIAHVDDARFAAELPGFDLVGIGQPQRPGLLAFQFRPRDRMRRHVHLRAGVAVDQQHVDVVRRIGTDRALVRDLKSQKRIASATCRDSQERSASE